MGGILLRFRFRVVTKTTSRACEVRPDHAITLVSNSRRVADPRCGQVLELREALHRGIRFEAHRNGSERVQVLTQTQYSLREPYYQQLKPPLVLAGPKFIR